MQSLLEFISQKANCNYLSDLRFFPYNLIGRIIFKITNLEKYSSKEVKDAYEYLFND